MKRILIPLLWLCYVNNSIAQPIPVDKLFKDDFFINPKISIAGEKFSSYIFLDNGEKLLVAYDFELKKFSQLAIFKDDVKLDNYQWLDDNSLFLTITHKKIIKNMLITLTIEQGEIVAKGSYLPWKGRYTFGYVVDLLPNEKDTIILGVYDDPQFRYERKLYQVQLKDLINFE